MDDNTLFGIRKAFLMAGAIGVLLGIVKRRQFNWLEATTAAISGASCVLWVAPAVVEWFGLRDGMAGLTYWACGLLGMYIVDFGSAIAANPWAAFRRWRNNGGDAGGGS